jgi:RNA ligase
VVSSKGSFTAWQIELAELLLANWKPRAGWTAMFELIDPANRIVVDYGTASGLTLLGATDNETGEDHFDPDDVADGMDWFGDTAIPREFNLQNMLQTISNPDNGVNKEGFVVVYPNPNGPSVRVKLKFARYREAHRTLSRLSNLVVWEALASDGLARLMEIVPDKLYKEVVECADALVLARATVESNARRDLSKLSKLRTRKEQAAHVKSTAMDNPKLVFALLDGRDITQGSWDVVKPHPVVPWSFLS